MCSTSIMITDLIDVYFLFKLFFFFKKWETCLRMNIGHMIIKMTTYYYSCDKNKVTCHGTTGIIPAPILLP